MTLRRDQRIDIVARSAFEVASSPNHPLWSMTARLPTNEQDRLEALRAHDVMDTAPEAEFDDLVEVASRVFGVPIALVTLVDEERQWSGVDTTPGICPECSEGLVAHDGE